MVISGIETAADLREFLRQELYKCSALTALGRPDDDPALFHARENVKFFSSLEALPPDPADWPADSRAALDALVAERGPEPLVSVRFRCRALGADGRCTIYPRRPYICSGFVPGADRGCSCCACWDPATSTCSPGHAAPSSVPPLEPARVLEATSPDA